MLALHGHPKPSYFTHYSLYRSALITPPLLAPQVPPNAQSLPQMDLLNRLEVLEIHGHRWTGRGPDRSGGGNRDRGGLKSRCLLVSRVAAAVEVGVGIRVGVGVRGAARQSHA